MTQKNSLSEWLEQTRRFTKNIDQICMDTIDSIIHVLPFIQKKVVYDEEEFFDRYCSYYHKPNPVQLLKDKKIGTSICKECDLTTDALTFCSRYVKDSVRRCWFGIHMVEEQWYEVIDFMWERPELVNPGLVDEYVRTKIEQVCKDFKKESPLVNGQWEKFGRQWKDTKGLWQEERRKRF